MDVSVPTRELADDDRPRIGEMFAGRYRIEAKLGEGGFGVVYAARDRQLERDVAIKVLDDAGDATVLARFLQEAKTIASLDSEHVVTLHEVAVAGRAPYLVMERLRGSDLAVVLREHRALPIETAVDYVLEAALGVAHAHGRGIVHRDLKPRNLFLAERTDGTRLVKVLDFGVAKAQTSELTESGAAIGTTRYMAPEQLRSSRSVDARTDIWALGAVLYELISGKPIFDGGSAAEIGVAILTDAHVPLRDRVPEIDATLAAAVDRCLAKDPDARFANVRELACALGAGEGLLARFARALRPANGPPDILPTKTSNPAGEARRDKTNRDQTRRTGSRWLVIGSMLLAVGGITFGIAMAMRAPIVERVVVAPDAALVAHEVGNMFDAAFVTGADARFAAMADASVVATIEPTDSGVVAIVRDVGPRRRPPPKPKGPTNDEIALISNICTRQPFNASPLFLQSGDGEYGCRQLALLGCAGITAGCAKYAVTDDEKVKCRNFIVRIKHKCP